MQQAMRRQKAPETPPPAGERIGYARVSTREQHLDLQLDALQKAGCLHIYEEKVSAAAKVRPVLDLAIKDLRSGDTLVVWRLDRLARSMRELYRRLDAIAANGAGLLSLNEHLDFSSATGRLMLHIFGALAEFERQLTIERTKAGLAALKAKGKQLGQPKKMTPEKAKQAREMMKQGMTGSDIARRLKVSLTTFQSWKNKKHFYANGKK